MNIDINTQSSIRIEGDKIIYFDPYQITEPNHDADFIFITHNHYDHFDLPSIKNIIKDNTKIIVPNSSAIEIITSGVGNKNLVGVDTNNDYTVEGLEFSTIPSYNPNKPFHPRSNNWVGYIITLNNEKIYVAGDTDITEENKQVKCNIALIPIGGKYTMDYKEAAELINIIKPNLVIPTHYGSIIGSKEDGQLFSELLEKDIECQLILK